MQRLTLKRILPLQCNHDPLQHLPFGEATNPGPVKLQETRLTGEKAQGTLTFGITNPTSIAYKAAQYEQLGLDLMSASETAATKAAQVHFPNEARQRGLKAIFSAPDEPQSTKRDGMGTIQGKAAGAAAISSLPMQSIRQATPNQATIASRQLRVRIQAGATCIQAFVVYGPTACACLDSKPPSCRNSLRVEAFGHVDLGRAAVKVRVNVSCSNMASFLKDPS